MHKRIMVAVFLLTLAPAIMAAQAIGLTGGAQLNPKWVKKYSQLQEKLTKQQGHKRAQTLAEMARYEYEFANASFNAHDVSAAEQYMAQMTAHADQACALLQVETKRGKKDGIKHVEESIQKIVFGLSGLEQSVDFREQPQVKAAADHFTNLNYELLQWLFAPKS